MPSDNQLQTINNFHENGSEGQYLNHCQLSSSFEPESTIVTTLLIASASLYLEYPSTVTLQRETSHVLFQAL